MRFFGVLLMLAALLGAGYLLTRERTAPAAALPVPAPSVGSAPASSLVSRSSPARPGAVADGAPVARAPLTLSAVTITARVLDAERAPVAGAELAVPALGGSSTARSDGIGHVRWYGEPQARTPTTAAVTLSAPGLSVARLEREWSPGEDLHLGDVVLVRAGSVRGVVVDEAGAPVAEAELLVVSEVQAGYETDPRELCAKSQTCRRATTDTGGAFALEGVAEGLRQVFARAPDRDWGASAPFTVRPGETVDGVRVALAPRVPRRFITGRVFAPDGSPTADALLLYDPFDAPTHGARRTRPGPDGRFVLELESARPQRVVVQPDEWQWSELAVASVPAGTRDVELRLVPARWLWVRVRDAAGAPVTSGSVEALERASDERQPRAVSDLWPDGRARLHRPLRDFRLRARAAGHSSRLSSPFALDSVAEPIELVLTPRPAVRGRVTHAGQGVADAEVELHLVDAADPPRLANRHARGRSGVDGEFVLDLPPSDRPLRIALRARADGHGESVAVLAVDPARGADGIELALAPGGAIEGRLFPPGGAPATGWKLVAHDARAVEHVALVEPGGAFRFQHLAPGTWRLTALEPGGRPRFVPGIEALVLPGGVARCDVRVPSEPLARLSGRLALEAESLDGWTAVARGPGGTRQAIVGTDGRFEVVFPRPGPVHVTLRSQAPRWRHLSLLASADLAAGDNALELACAVGEVHGHWRVPGAEEALVERLVLWRAGEGLAFEARVDVPPDGLPPTAIPAGEAFVRVEASPEVAEALSRMPQPQREFSILPPKIQVAPGASFDLALPR